jgi:hypothetical protein
VVGAGLYNRVTTVVRTVQCSAVQNSSEYRAE